MKKIQVHEHFRQLIAQNQDGKIHALQMSTESSIRSVQENSKELVTGRLQEAAYNRIDDQTEALVSMIGEHQVDYRFFIGFKLLLNEEEVSIKSMGTSIKTTLSTFVRDVNHHLMGDFVSMPHSEVARFLKMEQLLQNKIMRRFKVRALTKDDMAILSNTFMDRRALLLKITTIPSPMKREKRKHG